MPILSLLSKILGDPIEKAIQPYRKNVDLINKLEDDYSQLSDDQLKEKTTFFKNQLSEGKQLADILVDVFACVREVSKRVLNMRHFDVQLIGGMVLHEGRITEMKTGEGKTLVASLPAYLNALEGKGVYIVTVNDYLAKRDSEWMGKIYQFLGLSVGLIQAGMDPQDKLKAYQCDITYGTNNEFGFDYLRDNLAGDVSQCCQLRRHFAIIDEVDSILIDEARTPLIISGPVSDSTDNYKKVAKITKSLTKETHFTMDEKHKNIVLTEDGIETIETEMGLSDMYSVKNMEIAHMAVQCLRAKHLFKRDIDYVVKDGAILIVDEFTGRLMEGRRYSDGLHQAIEAIENLSIKEESQTLASVTFQNYFRMFPKLAGMTGTAVTEAAEFEKIYNLPVTVMPTNKPLARNDMADIIYKTKQVKFNAIVEEIAKVHESKQPVLVGTIAIETSELVSSLLKKRGIPHNVLNAKHHEQEAEIIANAGQQGAVTIATNMAGRGTDIVLGDGVIALGGLYVIGTSRHESRRIDNQLRGRSGRQGDPGKTRFYVSLEDDLMRLFGSDRIKSVMETLGMPDDMPIEHSMVSKSLEKAQTKVEKYHFGVRKQILQYDDVLNKQRETIYRVRHSILTESDYQLIYQEFLNRLIDDIRNEYPIEELIDEPLDGFKKRIEQILPVDNNEVLIKKIKEEKKMDALNKAIMSFYQYRRDEHPEHLFDYYVTKRVMLMCVDKKWMDHLHNMDILREGIGLRAYGQRDPLIEYKREAFGMFQELMIHISEEAVSMINRSVVVAQEETQSTVDMGAIQTNQSSESAAIKTVRKIDKIGRNERVKIQKGTAVKEVKWKHAEDMIKEEGWQLIAAETKL
ncbi:preprotein translocase subunit SecA [Candidatus Marinamargulisbacteria bacterium SCGC AG-333-B06]|nr:preprotein translocase subunit SecA [Candidatus Marinamargulisbacteria bacterium SCGC AG-333-B06]